LKITKRGGAKMRLDAGEPMLLQSMLEELHVVVAEADVAEVPGVPDAVAERLYPAAYEDGTAAAEYRELTERGLRSERLERIELCAAQLADEPLVVDVSGDAGDRWIRVLNDLRLVLGTKLGVTEDWDHAIDPSDPEQMPQAAYIWLTAVQDSLVRVLMG